MFLTISQSVSQRVSESASQSMSQSINDSISQSVSQPVSQSVNESVSQTVDELVSQSVSQSGSQAVSPSMTQSVFQSCSQWTGEVDPSFLFPKFFSYSSNFSMHQTFHPPFVRSSVYFHFSLWLPTNPLTQLSSFELKITPEYKH